MEKHKGKTSLKEEEKTKGKSSFKEEQKQPIVPGPAPGATPDPKDVAWAQEAMEIKAIDLGACENCQTAIKGPAVQALCKFWHPEHFVCTSCKKPITEQKFNVQDGKPYCEQDFNNKFLNKCRSCHLPIKDVTIQALGSSWHKDHFLCNTCGAQLTGQGFFERENCAFCQKCFESQFSPRCSVCSAPITETAMMALGKTFHPGCFQCAKCKEAFSGVGPFRLVNSELICGKCHAN